MRLFCLPYAGGSAALYRGWQQRVQPHVRVSSVQLPGRAHRALERPHDDLAGLLDSLYVALALRLHEPYSLFGHSLGALIWFEFVRYLRRRGMPLPAHLFVSACRAPHLPSSRAPIHQLPDQRFIEALGRYGGTPRAALDSTELMTILLPGLKADFRIVDTYQHRLEDPLEVPITAIGGREDVIVSRAEITGWRHHSRAQFSYFELPGGHFFIEDATEPVTNLVSRQLSTVAGLELRHGRCDVRQSQAS